MSREESFWERYWRLRREANELYQKQMREIAQQSHELIGKEIQKALNAMEDAINRGDYYEARGHQIILEALLR